MTILSVLLSILFSIQSSFISADKALTFEGSRKEPEFIQYGQNDNGSFRYGLLDEASEDGDDDLRLIVINNDSNIYGLKAKITVTSENGKYKKTGFITFNKSVSYTALLDTSVSETFIVNIKICNSEKFTFTFNVADLTEGN